jgi:GMP synthase PP-ATPase subunit
MADTDDSMTADWLASECGILKLKSSLVAEAVQTVAKLARAIRSSST